MSAQHTPGPWIVQESDFGASEFVITTQQRQDESRVPICEMDVDFDGRIGIEQKANVRLIAAAPELLAALREMVAGDAEAIKEAEAIGIPFPDEMLDPYQRAVSAIAKATGEAA